MELGPVDNHRFLLSVPAAQPEDRAQAAERRNLIKAVKELEKAPQLGVGVNQEMTFAFDRTARKTVVRIVDRQTREVVRQFPAEEILRMAERYRGR
jgi:flagellar protein FlaG